MVSLPKGGSPAQGGVSPFLKRVILFFKKPKWLPEIE